jgi:hypothetical protein
MARNLSLCPSLGRQALIKAHGTLLGLTRARPPVPRAVARARRVTARDLGKGRPISKDGTR